MKVSDYPIKKFSYADLQKMPYKYRELIYGRVFLKYILPVPLTTRIGLTIKGIKTMKNLKINYKICKTK